MIDDFTLEQCRKDREILQLKIKNLEHGINEAEKMIAESKLNLLIGCNVISELNSLFRQRLIKF